MSRTTGYTCTSVAEIFLDGSFSHAGIITPEHLAKKEGIFTRIMNYLEERGVEITISRLY